MAADMGGRTDSPRCQSSFFHVIIITVILSGRLPLFYSVQQQPRSFVHSLAVGRKAFISRLSTDGGSIAKSERGNLSLAKKREKDGWLPPDGRMDATPVKKFQSRCGGEGAEGQAWLGGIPKCKLYHAAALPLFPNKFAHLECM